MIIPPKPAITFGVVEDEKENGVGKLTVVLIVAPLGQQGSYEKVISPG